jgi:hypothetical protein
MKISRRPAARFGWSRGRRKSFLSRTCVAGRWEGKESGDLGDLEFGWGWGTESLLPGKESERFAQRSDFRWIF